MMNRKGNETLLWIIGAYIVVGLFAATLNASNLPFYGISTFSFPWWLEEIAVVLFWPYALFARLFLPESYSIWNIINKIL